MHTDPGLDNLLAVHACRQFDRVDELRLCFAAYNLWPKALSLRDTGRVDLSLQVQLHALSVPARVYENGKWSATDPICAQLSLEVPEAGTALACPIDFSEVITLPRHLPEVGRVSCLLAYPTPRLTELAVRQALGISGEGLAPSDAAPLVLEAILGESDRRLGPGYATAPPAWRMWVEASGRRNTRFGRYVCAGPTTSAAPMPWSWPPSSSFQARSCSGVWCRRRLASSPWRSCARWPD